ncbi:OmpH family outer membrane protein [Puia dinghuensis]|uniref:OmpH family outer membrane protein n=1 Tax=Puia dinghuensis TaxID=1792502 RepID=A0A8J2XPQ0_9BACT|nr:OmpH family outer membrane protein [Puia dinghuensis]GGA88804.1 hypothetical protein GCM10011511_10040 [Puia dinghuensis]
MKKTAFIFLFAGSLLSVASRAVAQDKTGCISINELLSVMPETKKADSALAEYKTALEQQFDAFQSEYSQQAALLASRDTVKLTRSQIDLKRRSLAELLARIQGYDQEASNLFNQKRSALLMPIQKKAEDAIWQVSKENGYAFIFEKENLHVYPPSADILPLVKKKLGIL